MSRTIKAQIPGLAGLTTQCRGEQVSFNEQGIGEADLLLMKQILACHPGTIIGEANVPQAPPPTKEEEQLLAPPPDEAEGLGEGSEEARGHPDGEQVGGLEQAPGAKQLLDEKDGEEKVLAEDAKVPEGESQPPPPSEVKAEVDLSVMSVFSLKKMARDLNVKLPEEATKKAEIIAVLEAVVNPCTAPAGE